MVELTEFYRYEKTVVFENEGGKLKITFKEWKFIAEAYRQFVDKSF